MVLSCSSLVANDVEHLFYVLVDHLYVFFGEMPIQVLCLFFNWMFVILSFLYVYVYTHTIYICIFWCIYTK